MNPSLPLEDDELLNIFSYEELKNQFISDTKINKSELEIELVKTPQLFSKYHNILSLIKNKTVKEQQILNKIINKRTEYYLGKGKPEDYAKEPFGLKVLKTEITRYLNSDCYIYEQKVIVNNLEHLIDFLEKGINSHINYRSNTIKTLLDYIKFSQGI